MQQIDDKAWLAQGRELGKEYDQACWDLGGWYNSGESAEVETDPVARAAMLQEWKARGMPLGENWSRLRLAICEWWNSCPRFQGLAETKAFLDEGWLDELKLREGQEAKPHEGDSQ